jgi:hypothetical protein
MQIESAQENTMNNHISIIRAIKAALLIHTTGGEPLRQSLKIAFQFRHLFNQMYKFGYDNTTIQDIFDQHGSTE